MNMKKRGISAVVATVLIILITVAAVTIIWAAIIPMINDQIAGGTLCLDAVSQVNIVDEGFTCFQAVGGCSVVTHPATGTCAAGDGSCTTQAICENATYTGTWPVTPAFVNVQVAHGAKDFDLAAVQVLVSEGGSTSTYELTTGLPGVNEEQVVRFDLSSNTSNPDSLQLAPIVAVGNTQETCSVSSEIALAACN